MKLLIETDIGRDLDDYLAVCFLHSMGVEIAAISVAPGDPDQLALVAGLRADLGATWKFGPSVLGRKKSSLAGVHKTLRQESIAPDGWGPDLFEEELAKEPHDLLVIGPANGMLDLLRRQDSMGGFNKIVVQGGFCSYSLYSPKHRLEKFEGKEVVNTFNLDGCISAAKLLIDVPCAERYFVGKNVCHTVVGSPRIVTGLRSKDIGMQLFQNALLRHFAAKWEKALHDVVAAACYLDPSIGTWVKGDPYRAVSGKWGTELHPDGSSILVDLDYPRFWNMLGELT